MHAHTRTRTERRSVLNIHHVPVGGAVSGEVQLQHVGGYTCDVRHGITGWKSSFPCVECLENLF